MLKSPLLPTNQTAFYSLESQMLPKQESLTGSASYSNVNSSENEPSRTTGGGAKTVFAEASKLVRPKEFELNKARETILEKTYCPEVFEFSRRNGVEDLAAVKAVYRAFHQSGIAMPSYSNEIYFHRNAQVKTVDMNAKVAHNISGALAQIYNGYDLNVLKDGSIFGEKQPASSLKAKYRGLVDGGINFIVSNKPESTNPYSIQGSDRVNIVTTFADVLRLGGRVHLDIGAAFSGCVIVEMPKGVGLPFDFSELETHEIVDQHSFSSRNSRGEPSEAGGSEGKIKNTLLSSLCLSCFSSK